MLSVMDGLIQGSDSGSLFDEKGRRFGELFIGLDRTANAFDPSCRFSEDSKRVATSLQPGTQPRKFRGLENGLAQSTQHGRILGIRVGDFDPDDSMRIRVAFNTVDGRRGSIGKDAFQLDGFHSMPSCVRNGAEPEHGQRGMQGLILECPSPGFWQTAAFRLSASELVVGKPARQTVTPLNLPVRDEPLDDISAVRAVEELLFENAAQRELVQPDVIQNLVVAIVHLPDLIVQILTGTEGVKLLQFVPIVRCSSQFDGRLMSIIRHDGVGEFLAMTGVFLAIFLGDPRRYAVRLICSHLQKDSPELQVMSRLRATRRASAVTSEEAAGETGGDDTGRADERLSPARIQRPRDGSEVGNWVILMPDTDRL